MIIETLRNYKGEKLTECKLSSNFLERYLDEMTNKKSSNYVDDADLSYTDVNYRNVKSHLQLGVKRLSKTIIICFTSNKPGTWKVNVS